MNRKIAFTENKIKNLIRRNESEWLIACGLKPSSYKEMLGALSMLRSYELYELEAMLVWKMEYLELDKIVEEDKTM